MASGLTLIFGVMGIVNLAHAAFMMMAAFIAYFAFKGLGIDPILSIVITMPAMFADRHRRLPPALRRLDRRPSPSAGRWCS